MKKNKQLIIDYFNQYQSDSNGITTKELADILTMQRTSVSTLLNQLVVEGLLAKSTGRPVQYFVKHHGLSNASFFSDIIGRNGTLTSQIEELQKALVYPLPKKTVLIAGEVGTQKERLVEDGFQYLLSKKIVPDHSIMKTMHCMLFLQKSTKEAVEILEKELASLSEHVSVLYIKKAELVDTGTLEILIQTIQAESAIDHILFTAEAKKRYIPSFFDFAIQLPSFDAYSKMDKQEYVSKIVNEQVAIIHQEIMMTRDILECFTNYQPEDGFRSVMMNRSGHGC